jgi:hypothetical protein
MGTDKGNPSPAEDAAWIELMHRAFQAPRFDSYDRQHQQLVQEVWAREPTLSPVLLAYAIWSRKRPDLLNLKTYTELMIEQAREARGAGNTGQAEQILREITGFGDRMTKGSATDLFEQVVGLGISRQGLTELQVLYRADGRYNDEKTVSAQLSEARARADQSIPSLGLFYETKVAPFRHRALVVQVAAFLIVLLAIASVLSWLLLELRPLWLRQRRTAADSMLQGIANCAPIGLVVACLTFLFSFRPFARFLDDSRFAHSPLPDARVLLDGWWALIEVPNPVAYFAGLRQWWVLVTTVLSVVLAFILLRGIVRRSGSSRV